MNATRRLLGAQAVGSFGLAAGGVSGGLLAAELTGSEAAGALPAGALALGAALTAPAITATMSRRGRGAGLRTGYAWALAAAAAALGAVALENLVLLVLASVLFGAGNTAVMLTRYAVADLAPADRHGRALSRSLVVTTLGAVVSPNLLSPAAGLASPLGLPDPAGLYVVSILAFGIAAAILSDGGTATATPPTVRAGPNPPTTRSDKQRRALLVLATANGIMVAVMTMGAVEHRAHGHDLTSVGLLVSLHVTAMFALAPVFGWWCDRLGADALARVGAAVLVAVGVLAVVVDVGDMVVMTALMMALGLGWSIQVVAGSALLIESAPGTSRQALEGRAELAMGLAAGLGTLLGAAPLAAVGGFRLLAATAAVVAAATAVRLGRSPASDGQALVNVSRGSG